MTLGKPPLPTQRTLSARFDAKLDRSGDCWLWIGFVDKAGYARIRSGGKHGEVLYAHRYSYERHVGEIPAGLQIDHLCRVRRCVNPTHLEAVTPRENARRGLRGVLTTSCPQGHEYDAVKRDGSRHCRVCDRLRHRARRSQVAA